MTPKEKATELLNKYFDATDRWVNSAEDIRFRVKCALIAVDEIISSHNKWDDYAQTNSEEYYYWQEVKQEIESL